MEVKVGQSHCCTLLTWSKQLVVVVICPSSKLAFNCKRDSLAQDDFYHDI